ncbi:MAG: ATP-binding protein [Desulfobacteraceae bacterium]|nr:ATP-binding protein [Desulfobacteraceae bacterium]
MGSVETSLGQTGSSEKLAGLAHIFHLLGTDCQRNIDIILEQTWQILDGVCSLYNRIDEKQRSLVVWAGHNRPQDLETESDAAGHICWEATVREENRAVAIPDIEKTPFFHTDPHVKRYNLKSYLGFPVKLRSRVIGSLCIVDKKIRAFTDDDLHCIRTLAAALSLEEERRALETELMEEKERYQTLVENANDATFIVQDGLLKFVNPRTVALSGYSWDALQGIPFIDLIHPDDRELVLRNHIQRLRGEKLALPYAFRIFNKKKDIVWLQINGARIVWEGRPAVLGCARDISRMKELEEKLDRAKKMELIGTMAGGVAHDLNNILSGLVSYPELLLMQISPDSPLKEPISFMHDAGLKAAEIVQDLLTLTRRGISVKNSINLNHVIHDYFTSPAHQRLVKTYPHIRFKVYPENDLLNIIGSASHLSKIIMNLVMNAAEAIKGSGTVTVESFNRYLDMPLKSCDHILEGEYAVLRVTDNGAGIPKKDLNKIFEPFYTKKQMGRSGSGLGLCVVWNCVKDHNGYIEVTSKINKGTTFELYFPATRKETDPEPEGLRIDDYKGNKETILVIDDVHEQRRIARESLKMLGYKSFTVPSGERALLFLKKRAVDLIILDMKMEPGMDGLDTYRRILKLHPNQKAVIASGFSENDRVREALKIGAGQYIKKPYTIKKLAHAIKEELADPKKYKENH